jgi:hypothetical protein
MEQTAPLRSCNRAPKRSKSRRLNRKLRKKRDKAKRNQKHPLVQDDSHEWESVPSCDDVFEDTKAALLHEPEIMYGYRYGVDLDEFVKTLDPTAELRAKWDGEVSSEETFECTLPRIVHRSDMMFGGQDLDEFVKRIDPLKQFEMLRELNTTGLIRPVRSPSTADTADRLTKRVQAACIAAAQLSDILPQSMDPTLSTEELAELKLTPNELVELTRRRSVYFTNRAEELPIVIDTGASLSLTPVRSDFVGEIHSCDTRDLQGISSSTKVVGKGLVEWTVRDVFGVIRRIRTEAYYVPDASIRLFSPQKYFQEQEAGEYVCDSKRATLKLADGSTLEFPFNRGSNLPLMLPDVNKSPVGLSFEEQNAMFARDANNMFISRADLSVADETNQNLTASQRELLKWHWRLGHANFSWIQRLASTPRTSPEGKGMPILRTKTPTVSSCPAPLCAACQMGKQTRTNPEVKVSTPIPEKEMSLKRGKLAPGAMVSIDQYTSTMPGRLPHTKGKEPKKDKYVGGTLFVDHATAYIYLRHQVSLRVGETLVGKHAFEQFAADHGVTIRAYRADNAPFAAKEFLNDLEQHEPKQMITYSGSGAHHQNGVAERAIQTVTRWARAMLLHACIHWPDQVDLSLWPFALEYAVYLWNHMPNRESMLAPLEVFSDSMFDSYAFLQRTHVWGCPAYVLDPKLQDGKKLPKWTPRSRRGKYLGPSPKHSTVVGRILNLRTGSISPQFHVVYDDLFSSVPNAEAGGVLELEQFREASWRTILESGHERILYREFGPDGRLIPPPSLSDEWLTPAEIRLREMSRNVRRRHVVRDRSDARARRARQPGNDFSNDPERQATRHDSRNDSEPVLAPEGEVTGGEAVTGSSPARPAPPQPPPLDSIEFRPDNTLESPTGSVDFDPDFDDDVADGNAGLDDDDRSITTLSPGVEPDDVPTIPGSEPIEDEAPETPDVERPRRLRRSPKKNRRYHNDDFEVYSASNRVPKGAMNKQYLQSLNWKLALNSIRSNDMRAMMRLMQRHTDPDTNTVEWMHPGLFGAKANSEDNPTWEEAMSGPDHEGYWEACKKEISTLTDDKDAWEEVVREHWMNVLPSTWAFKCKRFPDGRVRKLKARFCVRGDRQIEGVDYFDTFAPVVNWTTVRLMLILSVILGLSTRQVDYTAAFVHAPMEEDVYIDMPRGFSKPGKCLKLKKSLYGLKQSPRNFFQHLKGKLEDIGFESAEDVDPCLFISDKVICLVYVDDTLFYSPKPEYIDDVIRQLRERDMDLEEEGNVAGFLGVHLERNEKDGSIKLTQVGLIKRIIDALDLHNKPRKKTPAAAEPLVKDEDGDPPDGKYSYASVVGMLQYLQAHSRPDISFAVSQCARYVHQTRRSHEIAIERIGQYLKATQDEGLILRPSGRLDIDCYVDADFAGLWPYEDKQDPSCVKSRTGFVICLSDCPVIWSSKLQTDIATSTMEAEYNGLSLCMRDLLPFRRLFLAVARGVGLDDSVETTFKTTVWEDNAGALTLANMEPGRMTPRSKHYAVKYHWFRSHLKSTKPNAVEVKKIDTNLQKADIFTKGLRVEKFESIRLLLCGW